MLTQFRFILLALLVAGCSQPPQPAGRSSLPGPVSSVAERISPARTTVVWISIDGFRHDYMERFHPPTLRRLAAEGAFTVHEIPVFPSLTFPNHVSQVTGVPVDGHGIPMNDFLDEADGKTYSFPNSGRLLRAEPIWTTAQRQGVPTACIDWPLSYEQTGPNQAVYFDSEFDQQETDRHRLNRILEVLNREPDPRHPYRLVLGYMSNVDHVGHQAGPDSPQIAAAVLDADQDIKHFVDGVITWFNTTHTVDDELVLIFSTDHGMTPIKVQVSLERLIGADLAGNGTQIVGGGAMATIHSPSTQPDRPGLIVKRLSAYPFLKAWKAADVPAADHFSDPTRIGQVVVMLKPGYSFGKQPLAATMPVRGTPGTHGYDPADSTDLLGSAVIWRLRHPIGGHDLGPMVNTQWDATVCRLLGIQPPPNADSRAVLVP